MRITAIRPDGFDLYADESRCLDGTHADEQVAWLVIEATARGCFNSGDCNGLQVGLTNSPENHDDGFK